MLLRTGRLAIGVLTALLIGLLTAQPAAAQDVAISGGYGPTEVEAGKPF